MAYDFFVSFVYHSHVSILSLRLGNSKQWLECQQCCANQRFRIDDLGDSDAISVTDVYKGLIQTPFNRRSPLHICIIKLTSVINTNPCPYKLSEWKQLDQNHRLL